MLYNHMLCYDHLPDRVNQTLRNGGNIITMGLVIPPICISWASEHSVCTRSTSLETTGAWELGAWSLGQLHGNGIESIQLHQFNSVKVHHPKNIDLQR